jgi:hypothetical protein
MATPGFRRIQSFPGMKPFGEDPKIEDDLSVPWSRNDKHILLSFDNTSVDTSKGKRQNKDYVPGRTPRARAASSTPP